MSHDRGWRAACGVTIWNLGFHFGDSCDSTRRDGHGRWLWRLVRPTQKWNDAEPKSVALVESGEERIFFFADAASGYLG